MNQAKPKSAYQHLQELRRRLSWCVLVILAGSFMGYFFRDPIIAALKYPLGQNLFYTSPMGSFDFIMRICFVVGFLLALPVISYHILRFVEPALPTTLSRRMIIVTVISSFLLMIAGVMFGYLVSLPTALHFFNQVGSGSLQAIITADQYFKFVVTYLAIFSAIFQLPLILLLINRIKPLKPRRLGKFRKFVVIGSLGLGLITAPDPISQIVLALPIIALYEVSIIIIRLTNLRRPRHMTASAAEISSPLPARSAESPARVSVSLPSRTPTATQPSTSSRTTPPRAARRSAPAQAIDLRTAPVLDLRQPTPPAPQPQMTSHILDLRSLGAS